MKLTKSQLREIIKQELAEYSSTTSWKPGTTYETEEDLDEQSFEKVQLPGQIKRRMARFIGTLKGEKMNKMRQMAVLYTVIKGLGISSQDLMTYIARVKQSMKKR
jgi:hypothetical protein